MNNKNEADFILSAGNFECLRAKKLSEHTVIQCMYVTARSKLNSG